MALQNDNYTTREEPIKSQFVTREGTYKLMTLSEYSRPNKVPFCNQGNTSGNAPVRVSFLTVEDDADGVKDRICFNVGRELYIYPYRGLKKACDLNKPIDKRVYKGTFPTCHDFEPTTATAESSSLIIGFSAGQIQLIDPLRKDIPVSKLYNEERLIDKARVTCLKWLPGSSKYFLAAHASGQMYLYDEDLPCCSTVPAYQTFKQGDDFTVYTCKTKATRNPLYRWSIGDGAINEFVFSPDAKFLASVSQDGYLRIFNYELMELVGIMRSYFGGLLCCAWSPDGKYIVVGGEDDLVTVYSFHEKRIVCRGHGHRSWVSVVAFDPYTTSLGDVDVDLPGSDDDMRNSGTSCAVPPGPGGGGPGGALSATNLNAAELSSKLRYSFRLGRMKKSSASSQSLSLFSGMSFYRFGSVSHDTTLCLWDLTEDILRQPPPGRLRNSTFIPPSSFGGGPLPPLTIPNNFFVPHGASRGAGGGGPSDALGGSSSKETAANFHQQQRLPVLQVLQNDPISTLPTMGVDGAVGGPSGEPPANPAPGGSGSVRSNSLLKQKRNFLSGGSKPSSNRPTFPASLGRLSMGNAHATQTPKPGIETNTAEKYLRLLGTSLCPRLDEVASIEPLITKKIAHERLTVLIFREDCMITACQEGFICTWARPGKMGLSQQASINSPNPGGSPNHIPGGTIV